MAKKLGKPEKNTEEKAEKIPEKKKKVEPKREVPAKRPTPPPAKKFPQRDPMEPTDASARADNYDDKWNKKKR